MPTKRQKQILDFITSFQKKKGFAPSLEEIKKHLGLSSVSTIHFHVKKLQDEGFLNKEENSPRSISVFESQQMVKVPLMGTISAGQPIEAIQEKEIIAIPKNKVMRGGNFFALRVAGNSMIDENINDGDIVLVKEQQSAENGQKVVALIDNYAIQGLVIDVIKNEIFDKEIKREEKPNKFSKLPLNEIICGDAVDIMQTMPSDSIDLIVTSPPYDELRNYNGYAFNFEGIARELFRVMKKGGVMVWIVGDQTIKGNETGTSFRQALYFKQIGFDLFDTMIYLKTPRGAVGNNNTYWQTFEYMFILSKGTPKAINLIKDRENKDERSGDNGTKRLQDGTLLKLKRAGYSKYGRRTNVWEYLIGRGHSASDNIAYKHPAIFPERLVQDHITSWSNPGDVVFDPMCGSGTTCKMAKLNKRNFIGIDISSEYCKIAEERVKQNSLF